MKNKTSHPSMGEGWFRPFLVWALTIVLALTAVALIVPLVHAQDDKQTPVQRLSPRVRAQDLAPETLPPLEARLIEPFLVEPLVVDAATLALAPRIVAAPEARVLMARGDRAYARGPAGAPLTRAPDAGPLPAWGVFRQARELRDPVTQAVLGYETEFIGRARLLRGEEPGPQGGSDQRLPIPATLELEWAREEIRVGDRLLPEPPRPLTRYTPHAPQVPVAGGRILAMHGDAANLAGQNQVVIINKGRADGLDSGHVLLIRKEGPQVADRTQPGQRTRMALPDEANGLLMVFRPFEKVSYALILETPEGVRVGDRLTAPR